MRCRKCGREKPKREFARKNKPGYAATCTLCRARVRQRTLRERAKARAERKEARAAALPIPYIMRKTIEHYPRKPSVRLLRNDQVDPCWAAVYEALDAKAAEMRWAVGVHCHVNWCVRHECRTVREEKVTWCDLCLQEMAAYQLTIRPPSIIARVKLPEASVERTRYAVAAIDDGKAIELPGEELEPVWVE